MVDLVVVAEEWAVVRVEPVVRLVKEDLKPGVSELKLKVRELEMTNLKLELTESRVS